MRNQFRILIIGPFAEIGGVRTHVDYLAQVLSSYVSSLKITRGSYLHRMLIERFKMRPDVVIHNVAARRNAIIRSMFVKWILTSFGTKHILHIHGGVFSRITLSKYKLWFLFLKYYFRTFDHIFCLTKEQYRMAAKCLGSTRALQLVPNYVEIPDVNRLDKSDQNLNLLYIGRLHPDKGILDSVRAVQQLTGNNIRFWIIGSGELERHLAALRDPRINFLGKKFGEDKNSFLSKAHVFLQPTSWPEGMPYSLLEAAAHGLALISTPVGAIDQILLHGKNGYFVEKGNIEMIRHVLQIFEANRELVVQMGKTSRKICEQRFSVDRLQAQYDQLLPKLCARVVNPQKQPFHLPKRTS